MMFLKLTKTLSIEEVRAQIAEFEKRYGKKFDEYYKKDVKGHEDELDSEGALTEIEDWGDLVAALERMQHGEPGPTESFITPLPDDRAEEVQKLFTRKRLELLRHIRDASGSSVSQIARDLHRDRKTVTQDLAVFARLSLVGLEKTGRKVITKPEYSEIEIKIR
jgi:predicted transcriptional regulator